MKQSKNLGAIKWLLCAMALLAVLCTGGALGSATSAADGYMVHAVLVEQGDAGYTVAVLYQAPEAAANSAEVQAQTLLAQGQGASLAAAFTMLEQAMAAPISYQLSDYLLLCGAPSKALLVEYAALVQSMGCGRYTAQVCYTAQGVAALAQQMAAEPTTADTLLDLLQQSKQLPAKLFDCAQDCFTVPQIEQGADGDGTFAPLQTAYLLCDERAMPYDATQTQLYCLLGGNWGACSFVMGDVAFTIGGRVQSQSDVLAGVNGAGDALPSLHIYALVQSTSECSALTLRKMELYLEALASAQPTMLAQLGVSRVEVSLLCAEQWQF